MIKLKAAVCALVVALLLTGCSLPQVTIDGEPWDKSWQEIGVSLGVEDIEGFTRQNSGGFIPTQGLDMAVWTQGESVEYMTDDDRKMDLYDMQLYVLTHQLGTEELAKGATEEWMELERKNYELSEPKEASFAGQAFTRASITPKKTDGPYSGGELAIATNGVVAICVELLVKNGYEPDRPQSEIMDEFLSGFHYRGYEK